MAADTKKGSKKEAKPPSARDMIAKYDTDSDRKLDKTELHNALRSLKYNLVSTKNDAWKKFDTDNDDKIEQKELDALLESNSKAQEKTETEDQKGKAPAKGTTPKTKTS